MAVAAESRLPAYTGEAPASLFFQPRRPWLSLYGLNLRPGRPSAPECLPAAAASSSSGDARPCLVHRLLPPELLLEVFLRLGALNVARAAPACRAWAEAARHEAVWRACCCAAWPLEPRPALWRCAKERHGGSWRRLFLGKPRLRHDGVYVSRNTYVKPGVREWDYNPPVHMVLYFRYLRFLPDGGFLYKTSPAKPRAVGKVLSSGRLARADHTTYAGAAEFGGRRVRAVVRYGGRRPSSVHHWVRLRSTCPGANNRLDVDGIFMVDDGAEAPPPPPHGYAHDARGLGAGYELGEGTMASTKGLTTYVFVPWEDLEAHDLNLDVSEMDFYCPG